jgi:predicted TIM-barrel fold metal-dependent hydrolase
MNAVQNVIKDARHISEMANDKFKALPYKPISADSHVTEPPNLYKDYIDPKYRDRAPTTMIGPKGGTVWSIDGILDGKPYLVGMGSIAAAGIDPKEIKMDTQKFEDIHKGGHDPKARLAAQDRDGLGGEIIFPSIGMVLCNHPDIEFRQACFQAYNRWLAEFQSYAPDRLFGLGQSGAVSVEQTVADLVSIKELGFCGVMLPCEPATEFSYEDTRFDPVWEAAVALKLPITFHILTSPRESRAIVATISGEQNRGRSMAFFHHTLIRANQDVISTFVWGRVFERFPELKLVCAEADAGWVPHFMYRLDHFYRRHRFHSNLGDMANLPSQRVFDNVYFTFQDDLVAMNSLDMLNPRRLLWSSDFPHSDSTWPWSQQLLAYHTQNMSDDERRWILRDNTVECFNLTRAWNG